MHYDFTDEELDFIINYDIKYRMGKEFDVDDWDHTVGFQAKFANPSTGEIVFPNWY